MLAPSTEQTGANLSAASRIMMAQGERSRCTANRLIQLPLLNCYSDGGGPRTCTQDTKPPLAPTPSSRTCRTLTPFTAMEGQRNPFRPGGHNGGQSTVVRYVTHLC